MKNELSVVQMKEKRVINASICQYCKGQGEGFARREGWSSAISDRRAERSVKKAKLRERVRTSVEGNGAHVHITVSMSLAVLVEGGEVRGKGNNGR
jgi:hypothetical protein